MVYHIKSRNSVFVDSSPNRGYCESVFSVLSVGKCVLKQNSAKIVFEPNIIGFQKLTRL